MAYRSWSHPNVIIQKKHIPLKDQIEKKKNFQYTWSFVINFWVNYTFFLCEI